MKNNHISEKVLGQVKAAGLDEKQAQIYLSALRLGGGSITDLAKASGVERTGLYYYLQGLIELGLLKPSTTKKRTTYLPSQPDRLLELAQNKEKQVSDALPYLQTLFSDTQGQPQVSYYQGKEGIINLYEDTYSLLKNLKPEDNQLLIFARSFEILEALPEFFPGYIQKRQKLNLKVRAILPESERPKRGTSFDDPVTYAKYTQQIKDKRYMPDEFFPHSVVMIFSGYVSTIDYKDFFGSVTRSKGLSDTWAKFFEYIWKTLSE